MQPSAGVNSTTLFVSVIIRERRRRSTAARIERSLCRDVCVGVGVCVCGWVGGWVADPLETRPFPTYVTMPNLVVLGQRVWPHLRRSAG